MKTKNILTLFMALTFATTATFAVATPAYADCNINAQIRSGGACLKSVKTDYRYNYNYQNQNRNLSSSINDQMLLAMIARLQEMIRLLEQRIGDNNYYDDDDSEVEVFTRSATDIEEDSATLRGRVDLNREDEAEVYFEYGESRSDLDEETDHDTIDDNDDLTFEEDIDDLDDNTLYYYRAVAEDEDGDEDYGSIYSFRTDRDNDDLEMPDVETRQEDDVTDDEAELNGRVDMNDFNNGRVFFVYGEDESDVEDVEHDYDTYSDVDEQGDDLQKVLVDNDLDGSGTYQEIVDGLDADTRIYYSMCVEFEDEDDDDMISCDNAESFMTDDN